ncbi:MAG: mechanosensitive ion channel family protein, partial [Methylococcales bacterium]|nr:mechanosensitive ion channel family protein [Methylococcales bacterium]
MIEDARLLIETYFGIDPALQDKLISSVVIITILYFLRFLAWRFLLGETHRDPRTLYTWRKVIGYITVVLGFFFVGRLWLEGIHSLATYLGLVSAGLAIALQDVVVNLAGWGFIIWRRPFSVGDRIEIGDNQGDVIDVRLFEFSLLEIGNRVNAEQSTGRILHIPNGRVFTEVFANYNQGLPYIWNEIPVMITFESDWRKAKSLLLDIVNRHAPDVSEGLKRYRRRTDRRFVIAYRNVTPTVYTAVAESGVRLSLRYLVAPRKTRDTEQTMYEDILHAFAQHYDIDFAYPTQREYLHHEEKKRPELH